MYFAYKVGFFFLQKKYTGFAPDTMVFWVGRVLDSPLEGKGDALQFVIVILVFDETTRSDDVETASCLYHFSLPLNWICVTVLYLFSVLCGGKFPFFGVFSRKLLKRKQF